MVNCSRTKASTFNVHGLYRRFYLPTVKPDSAAKVADRNYEPHVSRTSLRRASREKPPVCPSYLFYPPLDSTTWHDSLGVRFSPVTVRNLINYSTPIIPRATIPPRNDRPSVHSFEIWPVQPTGLMESLFLFSLKGKKYTRREKFSAIPSVHDSFQRVIELTDIVRHEGNCLGVYVNCPNVCDMYLQI